MAPAGPAPVEISGLSYAYGEGELRRPLFARQGKAVVLNEAGRALVPQVREAFVTIQAFPDVRVLPVPAPDRLQPPNAEADEVTVHAGDYVEDRWTGLLWQKDGTASGKKNFNEARDYAADLELEGLKDVAGRRGRRRRSRR